MIVRTQKKSPDGLDGFVVNVWTFSMEYQTIKNTTANPTMTNRMTRRMSRIDCFLIGSGWEKWRCCGGFAAFFDEFVVDFGHAVLAAVDDIYVGGEVFTQVSDRSVPGCGKQTKVHGPFMLIECGFYNGKLVGHQVSCFSKEIHIPIPFIDSISFQDKDERQAISTDTIGLTLHHEADVAILSFRDVPCLANGVFNAVRT